MKVTKGEENRKNAREPRVTLSLDNVILQTKKKKKKGGMSEEG